METAAAVAAAAAMEAAEDHSRSGSDRRLAYEDFDLRRWDQFEAYRDGELFFTPQERQRLITSIISARPAEGGAGIDTDMLLDGKMWRVPLSAAEEQAEMAAEAAFFGWDEPVPLRDLSDGRDEHRVSSSCHSPPHIT